MKKKGPNEKINAEQLVMLEDEMKELSEDKDVVEDLKPSSKSWKSVC